MTGLPCHTTLEAAMGLPTGPLDEAQETPLRLYVDECLPRFEQRFERLYQNTETLSAEPTLFEKVRHCFQDPMLH